MDRYMPLFHPRSHRPKMPSRFIIRVTSGNFRLLNSLLTQMEARTK